MTRTTTTRVESSQLAVQDGLLDSKGVQVNGARSSSTAAARRPCAARSTSRRVSRSTVRRGTRFIAEDGQNVSIKFDVAKKVRPIVSVGKLQQDGKEVVLGKNSYIKECRGRRGVRRLGLFTIAALFFLRLQIAAGCATGPSMRKTTLGTKGTRCGLWRARRFPACRTMTQSTRWTYSRARMRKWRDRRHVGFLPQRSRPRRRSSGITLLMCHMLPGAVYVYEGEAANVDTKHKELTHVPTANHGPTSRWIISL